MHSSPTTVPLPQALDQHVLDIDGDVKAIIQVPGSQQWLVALDTGFNFCLARLNADLSLDESFGSCGEGFFYDNFDDHEGGLTAINHLAWVDGKILVSGVFFDFDVDRVAVARYHADGRPDTGFNNGGKCIVELPHSPRRFGRKRAGAIHSALCNPLAPLVRADGSLVLFFLEVDDQHPDGRAMLVCLTPDGRLDPGFNQLGFARLTYDGQEITPRGVALHGDNLLVYGATQPDKQGGSYALISRFDGRGHLDPSFNDNGWAVIGSPGVATLLTAVHVDDQGAVLAVGTCGNELLVNRRCNSGMPDPAFNQGMPLLVALPFALRTVKAMTQQPQGGVLIAAGIEERESRGALIRITADGSLDPRFAGGTGYLIAGRESEYLALDTKADGAIVVGGYLYHGGYYGWVQRFHRDGLPAGSQRAPSTTLRSRRARMLSKRVACPD